MKIDVVTVVGANGAMGSNVSGIFAAFGNAKVFMISRDIDKSKQAAQRAVKSVRADSIAQNLVPADYAMLPECVRASDLVFESVVEDLDTKLEITRQIAQHAKKDAILATGTSGLSITSLAQACPAYLQGRYFGIHMFNPPYNLPLCEVTPAQYTDMALFADIQQYLAQTLRRTVVEVKDSPAFLGNRVGFQFINRVLIYAEKYKDRGGIDYMDAILGPYTGRSMAPLVTSDFVGLDVHLAIVQNIYDNAPDVVRDTFDFPVFARRLVEEGKLGRKTRGGLYKQEVMEDGSKRMKVYDISTGTYRDKTSYAFPFADRMKKALRAGDYREALHILINDRSEEAEICLDCLLQYMAYSLYAASLVGHSVHAADDVMATGFNWCPPLAMAEAFSAATDLQALMRERLDASFLNQVKADELLANLEPSHYDYRPFFKSM